MPRSLGTPDQRDVSLFHTVEARGRVRWDDLDRRYIAVGGATGEAVARADAETVARLLTELRRRWPVGALTPD